MGTLIETLITSSVGISIGAIICGGVSLTLFALTRLCPKTLYKIYKFICEGKEKKND